MRRELLVDNNDTFAHNKPTYIGIKGDRAVLESEPLLTSPVERPVLS